MDKTLNIKKKLVGHVGVDAGIIWLGDPCYILHKKKLDKKSLGQDWGEFCDKLGEDFPTLVEFQEGVVVSSGFGDGNYPVFAHIKDGRVKKVWIEFF
jgi:hypothetical protein